MKLGVDVGGTHTDAVVIDGERILAVHKAATTSDITSGVQSALVTVLTKAGINRAQIQSVVIGTTSFTNAVVERRGLTRTAAVRIGLPSSTAVPPFSGWPADIRETLGGTFYPLHGGHEYDGKETIGLRENELANTAAMLRNDGIGAVAITAPFSSVNNSAELAVAAYLRAALPDLDITLSHEIGRLGLLERENAALLNAGLMRLASKVVSAFKQALADLDIQAPFFISQNDGSLMEARLVQQYPVLTFSSGPTNSMRGAAYLSRLQKAIVIDVGGTTADIGMVVDGYPRESNIAVEVGDVLTNLRMPDIIATPIGGGTRIRDTGMRLGPDSVGHRLTEEAHCFGGNSLTLTDILVAAGDIEIGSHSLKNCIARDVIENTKASLRQTLQRAIDRIKTDRTPIPLIAVGGAAFLVPRDLDGISEVIYPPYGDVANAIGAAMAQVSGEAEILYSPQTQTRSDALDYVKQKAMDKAVEAGAAPDTVKIVDIEEVPVAYMANGAERIRVRALGTPMLNKSNGGN